MIRRILGITAIIIASMIFASCSANNPNGTNPPVATTPGFSDETSTPMPEETTTPTPTQSPTPTPTPTPEPKEPVKVKALYLTGSTVAKSLDHYIDLANKTELNSLVIDIKENGIINYESQIPLAQELSLYKKVYDVKEVLEKCHDNDIYVIGRIVVFRDNNLSNKKPEYAIKKPNGDLWKRGKWAHGQIRT